MLDLSMMKKMAAESKTKGKKLNPHMTCVVNSCQGKVAGVCSWMVASRNYFNLAKVNTVLCMFTAALSLRQRVDDWIV